MKRGPTNAAIYCVFAASLLIAWEIGARTVPMVRLLLSSPSLSSSYAYSHAADLLHATAITGMESLLGFFLAAAVSSAALIACLFWDVLYRWIVPPIVVSQVVPLVSLAPFFILVFGVGPPGKIAMAATMCFFPIFVNMAAGVNSVPSAARDLAFVYGFTRGRTIFKVILPMAIPSLFAGVKIAATLSVIGAIVAEFNGAEIGLGKNLFLAAKRLEPELMMTSLVLCSGLGGAGYFAVSLLERRFGFWYLTPDTASSSNHENKP
jgi:NitT/TauT family transport system permease protein